MSESVDVPQFSEAEVRARLAAVYSLAVELGKKKWEQMDWGLFFKWNTDGEPDEWLCDKDGVVFTFEFLDEAQAMQVLLDPGNGAEIEVKKYDGDEASRPYPWPEEELITA